MSARHSPALRLIALLLALLLPAVQLGDGAGLHHCPDHDAGLGVSLSGHQGAHHGSSHDMPSHGHKGGCPCLGAGHTSQAAMVSGAVPGLVIRHVPSFAPRFEEPAVVWLALSKRLPFAIGPPAAFSSHIA